MAARRRRLAAAGLLVVIALATVYMWQYNIGPFASWNKIAGLQNEHMRAMPLERPSHLDLIFFRHGGVEFNAYGAGASVYITQYKWGEQVLHQRLSGIGFGNEWEFSGQVIWGVTLDGTEPHQLRVQYWGHGFSSSYFDFTQLGFERYNMPSTFNPWAETPRTAIERGRRYPLYVWQAGESVVWPRDVFDPDFLPEIENMVILYLVFD